MKRCICFLSILTLAFSVACASKKESGKKHTNDDDAPTPPGALAVIDNGNTIASSMMELDGVDGELEGGQSPGTLVVRGGLRSSYCGSSSAEPIHIDSSKNVTAGDITRMNDNLAEYPGALFFCKLTTNTYNFTSVQGASALPRMMLCGAGGKLKANASPLKISLTSSSKCVLDPEMKAVIDAPSSEGGMDGLMEFELVMVKPSAHAAQGWTFDVYAGNLGEGTQADLDGAMVKMSFRSTTTEAGYALYMDESDGSGIGGDTFQLTYKLGSSGTARLESRRQFVECSSSSPESCASGERKYTHHSRLLARGVIDEDGKVKSLTSLEGIDAIYDWNASTPLTDPADYTALYTIRGNSQKGFLTAGYKGSDAIPIPITLASLPATDADATLCFGGDGSCAGVVALQPASDADLDFMLDPHDQDILTAKEWFDLGGLLDFESVTFSN